MSFEFLVFSDQYRTLVENMLEEMIKNENPSPIVYDAIANIKIDLENYLGEKTKYSDYKVIKAFLFLFYQWLELILKGFLSAKGNLDTKKFLHHDIENLLEQFKDNYSDQKDLITFFEKYITKNCNPVFLKNFYDKNNVSAKDYYIIFRYPFNKKTYLEYEYTDITYTGKKGLDFFKDLLHDIKKHKTYIGILGHYIKTDKWLQNK